MYDRSNYSEAGQVDTSFFATPRGQSATLFTSHTAAGAWTVASRVKSFRDTNIENANVVPTKMFKIVGVSVGFVNESDAIATAHLNVIDREALRTGTYLQLRIVDKDIIFLPLLLIPELNPYVSIASTVNAVSSNATAGGGGSNVPMYKFPIPITINPYENFTVLMTAASGLVLNLDIDIYLVLHAYMRRPT